MCNWDIKLRNPTSVSPCVRSPCAKLQWRTAFARAHQQSIFDPLAAYTSQAFGRGMGVQKDVEDRSLPRPVGETGRRSVGNRKERLRDYASSPRNPNSPSSFWAQRSA